MGQFSTVACRFFCISRLARCQRVSSTNAQLSGGLHRAYIGPISRLYRLIYRFVVKTENKIKICGLTWGTSPQINPKTQIQKTPPYNTKTPQKSRFAVILVAKTPASHATAFTVHAAPFTVGHGRLRGIRPFTRSPPVPVRTRTAPARPPHVPPRPPRAPAMSNELD